uniref:Uncharacterized protein n=1 Tax=Amphilophus citrinellus TaxID=61819 RepID=A0A3Q0RBW5_AMPCI
TIFPIDCDVWSFFFLNKVYKMITQEQMKTFFSDMFVPANQVCEWCSPEQLKELLDLELRDRGESEILQRSHQIQSSPRFFNQLYAGMDNPTGSLCSQFRYTYLMALVFTLMEDAVLKKTMELIGWEDGDGPFNAGACHYCISKAAAFLGIGTKNVYAIPMYVCVCVRTRAQGAVPFMVNATAGTSAPGAFDPVEEIADICEKHTTCGCMVTLLLCCHSARASYLFQQDSFSDISYDTGDRSVQCSRKSDETKKREGFHILMESFSVSSFILQVAPVIKERTMKKGSMMGYMRDMDFVLDEIHNLGKNLR